MCLYPLEVLDMTHINMKLLVKFVFTASIKMIPGQNTACRWTLYWSRVDCDEKKRSLAPAVILAGDRLCLKMITTPPSPVTVQCPILARLTEQSNPCPHFTEQSFYSVKVRLFDNHLIFNHFSLRFAGSRPILSLQKPLTPHTFGRFWKSQHIKFYKITVSMLIYRGFRNFFVYQNCW